MTEKLNQALDELFDMSTQEELNEFLDDLFSSYLGDSGDFTAASALRKDHRKKVLISYALNELRNERHR